MSGAHGWCIHDLPSGQKKTRLLLIVMTHSTHGSSSAKRICAAPSVWVWPRNRTCSHAQGWLAGAQANTVLPVLGDRFSYGGLHLVTQSSNACSILTVLSSVDMCCPLVRPAGADEPTQQFVDCCDGVPHGKRQCRNKLTCDMARLVRQYKC